jgi:eukaryotic-like serine/threonine-protein kinase
MGEVYQARDTRLDRIVAVKVLSEAFAADGDRRARFEHEARAVAALNHPHICDLHDVGEGMAPPGSTWSAGTIPFLVMEHLEGPTLAARLVGGPLSLTEALRYAQEIADALDHAHSRGLIHRDLKPGNVMLTKTGAKLLDFGLSKLQHAHGVPTLATVSAEDLQLTAPGMLLGTFPYMAPELLEGHEADARSDVFALGAMVYEMVTGQRAFQGRTAAVLIGAILHTEPPPLSALQKLAPPALERLVTRCLAKRPEHRWQSARDVMLELNWIRDDKAQQHAPSPRHRKFGVMLPAAVAILAIVSVAFTISGRAPPRESTLRLALPAPDGLRLADVATAGPVTISPDGRRVVFAAVGPSGTQTLWVRPLDALTAQSLNGTEGGAYPFWSPDSQSIGFFAQRKLKRVQIGGGRPQTIGEAVVPRGGTWSKDGVIIFSAAAGRQLFRLSSQGGAMMALPPDGFNDERNWPSFLPDGRHFLYFGRPQKFGIYAGSPDSGVAVLLLNDYVSATYSAPGYLLGVLGSARGAPGGTLMAHSFDARSLELSGEARAIAEEIQYYSAPGNGAFSASENGTLVYSTTENPKPRLVWFDRRGNQLGSLGGTAAYGQASLSPDDKMVGVQRVDPITHNEDLWLIDTTRDVASRLTTDPNIDFMPVLAPDATGVVFASARGAPPNLFHKLFSGSQTDGERLVQSTYNQQPTDWSRDGRFIIYAGLNPRSQWDLWLLPMSPNSADRKPAPLLQTEFNEHLGRLSPNGRWLAYVSDESGTNEVYVRAFPKSETVRRISANGGSEPRWRGDGKELFYLAADRTLRAVVVSEEAGFETGAPGALFTIRIASTRNSGYDVNYTVTRDGLRFLVSAVTEEWGRFRTTIVINWPAALSSR